MAEENTAGVMTGKVHDIVSLLSAPDFLLRNNGDQVKIDTLKSKKLGLYFSASWCGPCHRFTPILAEAYEELQAKGDFEVVFVSADKDEEAFKEYFSKMPWLAIPFTDSGKRDSLDELFEVQGIPHLVIIDEAGRVTSDSGVEIVGEYGAEAYPFTSERIKELKDTEEEARRNQTLKSILVHKSRDFVLSSDGSKVSVSALEGKMVGIYFSLSSEDSCVDFNPKLLKLYEELKAKGENFEVVLVPLDSDEEAFEQSFKTMPWVCLPVKDRTCMKLVQYFELETLPTLVIIGSDGKTVHSNVAEAVEEHGVLAYPFTPEKFAELAEIEKAKAEAQTLESILVSGDLDFVIGKEGAKVPVADLVGKNILLYFSAHWCPPCRAFLPKLIEAYHEIKSKEDAFEVIFISSDRDQASFEDFFSGMPWLALPFGDPRKSSLSRKFKVRGIPTVVALGPSGRTVTLNARDMIMSHGADAYPFTEEQVKKLAEIEKAKAEAQTLESILVSGDLDFVIGKEGAKVPVADLVGKNILLYFSAHWCPPCRAFLPKLIEAYREIKSKEDAFEVIFISSDRDQASFEDFFSGMPWLALPFGDPRKSSLSRKFKVMGIPTVVALGPTGRTVTSNARGLIMNHGADAYPFTEEHVNKLEAKLKEMVKGWPEKLKHMSHDHELVLSQRMQYGCDVCKEGGQTWSYFCEECDFDLHPKCAFKEEKAADTVDEEANPNAEETQGAGWVCDGDVCRKA